jgi:putative transposase
MITVHKIALNPNNKQRTYFARSSGVARFAYNWALAEWQRQHKTGEKPNEVKLRRELNAVKRSQFPWMLEVSKNVPQQAIKNLGKGYARAFKNVKLGRKRGKKNPYGFPVFKKKGAHDSFRADNGPDKKHPNAVEVEGKKVKLPVIGWIRMHEKLRFEGVIKSAVVSREADRWFVALSVEIEEPKQRHCETVIGVDLGVKDLAVVSDERRFKASKALKLNLRRLRRTNKELSRRKKKSANWLKTKAKLAKLHSRISNLRKDCLHKTTTDIVRSAGVIVLEDLNVSGMLANHQARDGRKEHGFRVGTAASRPKRLHLGLQRARRI